MGHLISLLIGIAALAALLMVGFIIATHPVLLIIFLAAAFLFFAYIAGDNIFNSFK